MTTPTNPQADKHDTPNVPEQGSSSTWTRQNVFDPAVVRKSKTISPWQRLRLLFHKSKYAYDVAPDIWTLTRYKVMDGVAYILDVKRGNTEVEGVRNGSN